MKLLVTRPAADSAALATLLEAQGHEVLIDPMLEVRALQTAVALPADVTGLLFTSANGVRAFTAIDPRRDLPVYAVGDRTAEAARLAGFTAVESADGDVEALVRLVAARRKPEDGALFHVSGAVRAGNLAETLGAQGFTVHHASLYEAVAATALAAATQEAIRAGSLDGVLLFSPRTAKHFAELVAASELGDRARRLQAWCLSKAVAEALAPLRLAGIHIAAEPTQASLLKALGVPKSESAAVDSAPGSATASPAAAPGSARRGGRLWAVAAALVLVAVAVVATREQWLPLVAPQTRTAEEVPSAGNATRVQPASTTTAHAPAAQVVASGQTVPPPAASETRPAGVSGADSGSLTQRLERLEAALDGIRADAGSAAPKAALTALQGQLADLGQQLGTVAARPVADPQVLKDLVDQTRRLAATVAQLSDRLTPLEARINQKAATIRNDRTLVLAAGQIRDALAGSGPFVAPVAVIRAVAAPDDPALSAPLAVLVRHAEAGVPSRVRLAQELAALPAKLAQPAPLAPDAGVLERLNDKLHRLVTIRRVDDGSVAGGLPPGPDRMIEDAGQALAAGDLAGALEILRRLDGPAAAAAKPWLDTAQARLDCEQAALALETAATKRLGGPTDIGAAE